MKIFIWESVDYMSRHYHPQGGVVIIAKSLQAARKLWGKNWEDIIAEKDWKDEPESTDTTIFNTKPTLVLETNAIEPRIFEFPDAGCC